MMRKDLPRVLSTNVINLAIGIISGLIIPAFLSIDQYAHLKTFTLYISYIGILHFGFTDGIFLKYGGLYKDKIDIPIISSEHKFFLRFQFVVSSVLGVIAFLSKDVIIAAVSLSIIPYNTITFFKSFYQAVGDFKLYTRTIIVSPLILLILNLLLIFVVKVNSFLLFVGSNVFAQTMVFIILEVNFLRDISKDKNEIIRIDISQLFKSGFLIMIGNLSAMLFFEIDRWFVKVFLSLEEFAIYSFAASMMAMIMIFINSITAVFYPYLSRNDNKLKHLELKRYFIILGSIASSSYFAFSIIVNNFMPKYIASLEVISILFVAFPVIIVTRALYVNLYKVEKRTKTYSRIVTLMLFMSAIMNSVSIYIFRNNTSVAIATTISFVLWFFISMYHFNWLKSDKKEISFLVIFSIIFFATTNIANYFVGFILYIFLLSLLILVCYKEDMLNMLQLFRKTKISK